MQAESKQQREDDNELDEIVLASFVPIVFPAFVPNMLRETRQESQNTELLELYAKVASHGTFTKPLRDNIFNACKPIEHLMATYGEQEVINHSKKATELLELLLNKASIDETQTILLCLWEHFLLQKKHGLPVDTLFGQGKLGPVSFLNKVKNAYAPLPQGFLHLKKFLKTWISTGSDNNAKKTELRNFLASMGTQNWLMIANDTEERAVFKSQERFRGELPIAMLAWTLICDLDVDMTFVERFDAYWLCKHFADWINDANHCDDAFALIDSLLKSSIGPGETSGLLSLREKIEQKLSLLRQCTETASFAARLDTQRERTEKYVPEPRKRDARIEFQLTNTLDVDDLFLELTSIELGLMFVYLQLDFSFSADPLHRMAPSKKQKLVHKALTEKDSNNRLDIWKDIFDLNIPLEPDEFTNALQACSSLPHLHHVQLANRIRFSRTAIGILSKLIKSAAPEDIWPIVQCGWRNEEVLGVPRSESRFDLSTVFGNLSKAHPERIVALHKVYLSARGNERVDRLLENIECAKHALKFGGKDSEQHLTRKECQLARFLLALMEKEIKICFHNEMNENSQSLEGCLNTLKTWTRFIDLDFKLSDSERVSLIELCRSSSNFLSRGEFYTIQDWRMFLELREETKALLEKIQTKRLKSDELRTISQVLINIWEYALNKTAAAVGEVRVNGRGGVQKASIDFLFSRAKHSHPWKQILDSNGQIDEQSGRQIIQFLKKVVTNCERKLIQLEAAQQLLGISCRCTLSCKNSEESDLEKKSLETINSKSRITSLVTKEADVGKSQSVSALFCLFVLHLENCCDTIKLTRQLKVILSLLKTVADLKQRTAEIESTQLMSRRKCSCSKLRARNVLEHHEVDTDIDSAYFTALTEESSDKES